MAASYQTLDNVFSDVRYISGKDSTTLQNADLLRLANKYYLLMFRELVDLNEEFYAQISFTDLVAGQREYPLPVDDATGAGPGSDAFGGGLIKLQRAEITYDGTNHRVMDPISLQEIATPTRLDSDINFTFDKQNPKYWYKDRSIWIAPIPQAGDAVQVGNGGLFIYWIRRLNELASVSEVPDLPKDFLGVLAEGILIDVFRRYGRGSDTRQAQANWDAGLINMREKAAAPDFEQPLIMKPGLKNYK